MINLGRSAFSVSIILTLVGSARGQILDSSMERAICKVDSYLAHRPGVLFVHLDKQIYNGDESISFTCYTLDEGPDSVPATCLHVVLIDPANGATVARDQFNIIGGFSSGSLVVPDTIADGPYLFMASTNSMEHLSSMMPFTEVIMVKSTFRNSFEFSTAEIIRKPSSPDSLFLHARIITDSNGLASRGVFEYKIRGGGRTLLSGKRLIDPFGEVDLSVPPCDSTLHNLTIAAVVSRGKKVQKLSRSIVVAPNRINVGYFPEGGSLINGLPAKMIVSLWRDDGTAIHGTGGIYTDSGDVVRFQTDLYGLATVKLLPVVGKKYELRLDDQPSGTYLCGTFPTVDSEGVDLQLAKGVVRDSVTIRMETPAGGKSYRAMIYSAGRILYAGKWSFRRQWAILTLSTKGWPTGLAHLVLLSADDRPVAERTFYVSPPQLTVKIETDSTEYHQRSKVRVRVKVTVEAGKPVRSVFSVGATMAARVRTESLMELGRSMPPGSSAFLPLPPASYCKDDEAFDQVLISGLSGYLAWGRLDSLTGKWLSLHHYDNSGYVLHNDKTLKRPLEISILGHAVSRITTDSTGRFEVPDSVLVAPPGVDPGVVVTSGGYQGDYQLFVVNRYDSVVRRIAQTAWIPLFLKPGVQLSSSEPLASPFDGAKRLKAAVVVARPDDDIPIGSGGECTDWVYLNNILNCMNHYHTGKKPVVGQEYKYAGPAATPTGMIIYKHCMTCRSCYVEKAQTFLTAISGIHLPWEPYNVDSVKFDPTLPALYSTLYWSPLVLTDDKGEAVFAFYTNDIKGRFVTLLQGMSSVGALKGQAFFSVVGPEEVSKTNQSN